MFNLSGAINVLLLLLIARPQLLLFTPSEKFIDPEVDLGHSNAGSVLFPDTAIYNHSPQPTGTRLADDAEDGAWNPTFDGNNVALSRIDSRPRSDDV